VGTAYKQESREAAIKIGLDFFGTKMRKMVEEAETILSNHLTHTKQQGAKKILVHCWRGGMRSAAVAWLLDLYGYKVFTLAGGYKNFRHYVLDTFKIPFQLKIIGGYTGSGKTELLKQLKEKGETVIDLEGIAGHKGSAFGNIGLPDQPGQEMFENILSLELRAAETTRRAIWVEDESQRIGLVNLPNEFWKTMRCSPIYFLDIPFEERLKQIVKEYGNLNQEKMIGAIGRISEKLGHLNAKTAILLLKEGKISESFTILLRYYDKFYFKALHNREAINSLLYQIQCKSVTPENANQIILQNQQSPVQPERT